MSGASEREAQQALLQRRRQALARLGRELAEKRRRMLARLAAPGGGSG